jgi:hypothetical protein
MINRLEVKLLPYDAGQNSNSMKSAVNDRFIDYLEEIVSEFQWEIWDVR